MIWIVALTACTSVPPAPAPIRPVRTLVVQESGGALSGTFSATTRAGHEANLSFRTGGTVEEVAVSVGETVEAGALLARLDASDLRLQLQQSQASVAQADANAQLAARSMERVEKLYVDDNASAADVDSARAQSQSAKAAWVSAVRQRDLARRQLDAAELRATQAGRIAQVLVRANENVGTGTPVVVLTPDEALQVTVAVPAGWVERLETGASASVALPELDLTQPARVTEVGGTSQTAGSFPVTVQLLERNAQVRPGLVAEVELSLPASGEARIELPLSAISEDSDGRFVWRVTGEPPTVQRVRVTTGDLTADGMVLFDGVAPGDRVVIAGLSQLYEGRVVRLGDR